MPRKSKVLGYADKQYHQSEHLFPSLYQAFLDFKQEKENLKGWNTPVAQLNGVTMKMINDKEFCLTYHRVEVGTIESIAHLESNGKEFLKEVEKGLKQRFKDLTGKVIKFKKTRDDQDFEQYSVMQADTSWQVGSSRYGYHSRPVGKFFVRDTFVYEIDPEFTL